MSDRLTVPQLTNWLDAMKRLVRAEELLREVLTYNEIGNDGPFKSKVREFLKESQ